MLEEEPRLILLLVLAVLVNLVLHFHRIGASEERSVMDQGVQIRLGRRWSWLSHRSATGRRRSLLLIDVFQSLLCKHLLRTWKAAIIKLLLSWERTLGSTGCLHEEPTLELGCLLFEEVVWIVEASGVADA